MNIAIMIAAHTDPLQLKRLVDSLCGLGADFYIHIDKKKNIDPFVNALKDNAVNLISKRIYTNWGGKSQCEYQRNLIEAVLNSGKIYDRVFFLLGLDYPLWNNNRILDYMECNPHRELIMGMNLSDCYKPRKMQTRVRQFHYRDLPIRNLTIRRFLYAGIREILDCLHIRKNNYVMVGNRECKVYCGSSWWCLTGECLKYVYDTICNQKEYWNYFKTCLAPDEMLIQTIVFNSKYASKAILYEGDYPGLVGLTPLHYIEYDKEIHTYTEKDFEKLIASGKMFVRKVQSCVSDELIRMIDRYRVG